MDIIQLYHDYNVTYVTEGHKHARVGWVNTACPFCTGNIGYHLGYNLSDNYYYCWRCGWHAIADTVSKLANLPLKTVFAILPTYGAFTATLPKSDSLPLPTKEHRLPSNIMPLTAKHRTYLSNRRFDPDKLVKQWMLTSTGPVSVLDTINYRHRIVIPIIWDGVQVSFTTRSPNAHNTLRYISCPKARERIHHKSILYGNQHQWTSTGICVEGATDVWRLGERSFATFGIEYTNAQVRVMARDFKRIFVVYDDDPQAVQQALRLVAELRFRGVDAHRISIQGDPSSMEQSDANYLVKQCK